MKLLGTAAAVLGSIILWSCGSDDPGLDSSGNVQEFRELVSDGVDFDYNPLDSPAEAVEEADLIIVGTVTGATEGKWWTSTELRGGQRRPSIRYAVLDVEVDGVISTASDTASAPTRVSVALTVSHSPDWDEIERSLPMGRVLLILGDRSEWRATADVEGIPEQVYEPSPDGIWFATDAGFEGVAVDSAELEARWGSQFSTLDAVASALDAAAK